jgi:hypothetical protein
MMPGQHGTSLKDYTKALTVQLRLRDVPGSEIGQIVAEVESHVRETGEDPVEAFGQPGSYSAQFAVERTQGSQGGPGRRRGWALVRVGGTTTALVAGALMLLEGGFSLGEVILVSANMVLAWLAIGLMFALVVHRVDLVMADRETRTVTAGRPVEGSRLGGVLRFVALLATFGVGQAIRSSSPQGPILLSPPGWVLVLAGLVLVAAAIGVLLRRYDRIVDPRDPQ